MVFYSAKQNTITLNQQGNTVFRDSLGLSTHLDRKFYQQAVLHENFTVELADLYENSTVQ